MKIIYSNILKKYPEIKFGFSTKDGGVSPSPYFMNLSTNVGDKKENVKRNREIFFNALGILSENVSIQNQIHSTNIHYVTQPSFVKDNDGMFTDRRNVYLAVSGADCVTIFLFEPDKKIIAGVHSGWKGTYGRILAKTVKEMKEKFSIDTSKLIAYIGPAISQDYYEVGKEVADLFDERVKAYRDGKYSLDLKKSNLYQLLSLGVRKENIEVSEHCTFKEENLFHSHRRDGEKTGRMFGVIGME